MSNTASAAAAAAAAVKKPFCKVCFDSGRSAAVYESHYVRMWPGDNAAPVTCPLLLSNRCRRCGELGHTYSFCKSKNIPRSLSERFASMDVNCVDNNSSVARFEKLLSFEEWRERERELDAQNKTNNSITDHEQQCDCLSCHLTTFSLTERKNYSLF